MALRQFPSDGHGFALLQTISVTPGQRYVLSGLMQASELTSGSLYLDLNDVDWYNGTDLQIHFDISRDGWQFFSEAFTVPSTVNSITARIVRDGTNVAGEPFFADEIALTPIDQFAPPVFSSSFRSIFTIDKTGPSVLSIVPTGEVNNTVNAVTLTFSDDLDASTLSVGGH